MKLYGYTNIYDFQLFLTYGAILPKRDIKSIYGSILSIVPNGILLLTKKINRNLIDSYCKHNTISSCVIAINEDKLSGINVYIINKDYYLREGKINELNNEDLGVIVNNHIPIFLIENVQFLDSTIQDVFFENTPSYDCFLNNNPFNTEEYDMDIEKIEKYGYSISTNKEIEYYNKIRGAYLGFYSSGKFVKPNFFSNINRDIYNNIKTENDPEFDSQLKWVKNYYKKQINSYDNEILNKVDNILEITLKSLTSNSKHQIFEYFTTFNDNEIMIKLLSVHVLIEMFIKCKFASNRDFILHFNNIYSNIYQNNFKSIMIMDDVYMLLQFVKSFEDDTYHQIFSFINENKYNNILKILYLLYLNFDKNYKTFSYNIQMHELNKSDCMLLYFLYGLYKGISVFPGEEKDLLLLRFLETKYNILNGKCNNSFSTYTLDSPMEIVNKFKIKPGQLTDDGYNIVVFDIDNIMKKIHNVIGKELDESPFCSYDYKLELNLKYMKNTFSLKERKNTY